MDNNNALIPGFDNDKDDSLTISLRKAEGVPHGMFIYLSGYIDTYNSSFFQKQIQKIMDAGFKYYCVALDYKERIAGTSKWTLAKKIKLFIDSFVAFSLAINKLSLIVPLNI